MPATKLSALLELAATPATDDELYIRDISEIAADESKRITVNNVSSFYDARTATMTNKTLTAPTIVATGWTNANHAHAAANSGGQVGHGDLSSVTANQHHNQAHAAADHNAATLPSTFNETLNDDIRFLLGTGGPSGIQWETADANANYLQIQLPAGGVVDVPVIVIGEALDGVDLGLYDGVVNPLLALMSSGAVATASIWDFRKARGTLSAPTVITTGDDLGSIRAFGYSGAGGYVEAARIEFDSTGTIATTRVPGLIRFSTGTDAAPTVLTTRLTINSAGLATFANSVQIDGTTGNTLVVDTNTFVVDATNNRVGVNKVDPDVALHVIETGSASLATVFLDNTAASSRGSGLRFYQNSVFRGILGVSGHIEGNTSGNMGWYSEVTINLYPGGSGVALCTWDSNANMGLNTTTFGTGAVREFALGNTSAVLGAALADKAQLACIDIAAGDARLQIQAELGGVISLGNNTIRIALAAGSLVDTVSLNASNDMIKVVSSERYKVNVRDLEMDSRVIYDVGVKAFEWAEHTANPGLSDYGVTAERAYAAHPSLAVLNGEGQVENVHWHRLQSLMLLELQRHEMRIAELEAELRHA